jgi:hypothetical protein
MLWQPEDRGLQLKKRVLSAVRGIAYDSGILGGKTGKDGERVGEVSNQIRGQSPNSSIKDHRV